MSHNLRSDPSSGSDSSGATSPSLLEGVKARDPEAWQRLVKLYGPLIYRCCRRAGLQGSDAADIAQDTFVAVAANVAGFCWEQPGDSFRVWLWTITQNKIRDHFRRHRGQEQGEGGTAAVERLAQVAEALAPSTTQGLRPLGSDLERRAIELVRAGVEERTWQAFWRVAVEGLPAADVAQELGMGVQAVYDAGYRIRRRIRAELRGLIDP